MNLSAVFHRTGDNFCYPLNSDELEINIKTGKDIESVYLCYADPYNYVDENGGSTWKPEEEIPMERRFEDVFHFLWRAVITPKFKRARYYFKLFDGNEEMCFTESGIFREAQLKEMNNTVWHFTFPWMNASDICTPPKWAEETVWYQIFPTRFSRAPKETSGAETREFLPWPETSRKVTNSERFGGNLQGIIARLSYLKDLGITGLYLNPVNKAKSEHKYDTSDYFEIDETLGDKVEMKNFVQVAHEAGMRVMTDGVFNHSGAAFFAWQDVLKNGEASLYKNWFMIRDFSFIEEHKKRNNGGFAREGKYFSFAFSDNMPKLNTNNVELQEYLLSALEMWIKEYDIDGIRLDVANELSHNFCKKLRQRALALKADFFIMGEIWHDSLLWLRGDEFDSVMNYPLLNSILNFFLDENLSTRDLMCGVNRCFSMYSSQTNRVLFNQADSHDVMRIATRLGSKAKALSALALIFFMPGSVCLYYGTEILLEGGNDPDNRRCMPWKEIENGKYEAEISFFKKLISLRKSEAEMRSDEFSFVFSESFPRLVIIKKGEAKGALHLVLNVGSSPVYNDLLKNADVILENGSVKNGVIDGNSLALFRPKDS